MANQQPWYHHRFLLAYAVYEPLQSHSLQSIYRGYSSVLCALDGDYFTVKYMPLNQWEFGTVFASTTDKVVLNGLHNFIRAPPRYMVPLCSWGKGRYPYFVPRGIVSRQEKPLIKRWSCAVPYPVVWYGTVRYVMRGDFQGSTSTQCSERSTVNDYFLHRDNYIQSCLKI